MSKYLCGNCEKSVLFNGGAYCRHFECVKGTVTGCTSYKPIEQEDSPPPFTNADLIRSADTEIEMVDIILKLVKKIPEGEDKRRTLYQLLMKEAGE